MIKYLCPGCNDLMKGPYTIVAACDPCEIIYFFSCPLTESNNEDCNFYYKLLKIHHGSFEECCRVFKLKIFL